jgi:hypothetical protein
MMLDKKSQQLKNKKLGKLIAGRPDKKPRD